VLPDGMVLYQNGYGTYFDWPGLTPRLVLPQMLYYDFDGDGKKELAVTVYSGSGTGVDMMDLYILTIEDGDNESKPSYTEHSLLSLDVDEWMTEEIITTLADDGKSFNLGFVGNSYTIDCIAGMDSGAFTGIAFGDIVYFSFEESRIRAKIALGAAYENSAVPDYFGCVEAYVIFDGAALTLSDYTFTLDSEVAE
jgi:hypothetical protein